LPWLRPFAVTGNLSVDVPTKTQSAGIPNPNNFNYGFALEYSLEYLQHHVQDVGLTAPFDRLIPLVEVSFTTGLNRGAGGQTTGTIQPGIIWAGSITRSAPRRSSRSIGPRGMVSAGSCNCTCSSTIYSRTASANHCSVIKRCGGHPFILPAG